MVEDYGEVADVDVDLEDPLEEKKDNKVWIIIAVVLVVLCCCCLVVGGGVYWLWSNGDDLFDLTVRFPYFLL